MDLCAWSCLASLVSCGVGLLHTLAICSPFPPSLDVSLPLQHCLLQEDQMISTQFVIFVRWIKDYVLFKVILFHVLACRVHISISVYTCMGVTEDDLWPNIRGHTILSVSVNTQEQQYGRFIGYAFLSPIGSSCFRITLWHEQGEWLLFLPLHSLCNNCPNPQLLKSRSQVECNASKKFGRTCPVSRTAKPSSLKWQEILYICLKYIHPAAGFQVELSVLMTSSEPYHQILASCIHYAVLWYLCPFGRGAGDGATINCLVIAGPRETPLQYSRPFLLFAVGCVSTQALMVVLALSVVYQW